MNIYEETQLLELEAQRLFKPVQCCALRKSSPRQKLASAKTYLCPVGNQS
ncbi:rCG35066 [Rattus norvegicus]|uniref:RCG35066 n=1 Tax=Rattus norvegicus TaxID=10116 RepID=A6HJE0_RAT|nr:rCG35066 [Rattus norvegicus]